MGVMDRLFGVNTGNNIPAPTSGANPAPQVAVIATGSQGAVNNNQQQPINNNQQQPTEAVVEEKPSSPLDKFSTIWQTPTDAKGQPIKTAPDLLATDVFNFDPAKITEQAKGLDFVKDVNPELVARVQAGGPDGTVALLELLNAVQQSAFAAATLSAGNMINAGMRKNNANIRSSLPRDIRSVQLNDTSIGDNPVLSHPAVRPLVHALRVTAFNKDPNANPADVTGKVNEFIMGLAEALRDQSPDALKANAEAAAKKTNWDDYFGS